MSGRADFSAYAPTVHVRVNRMQKHGALAECKDDLRVIGQKVGRDAYAHLRKEMLARRGRPEMSDAETRAWSARTTLELDVDRFVCVDEKNVSHDLTKLVRAAVDDTLAALMMLDAELSDDEKAAALHGYNFAARAAQQALEFAP